jgi:hypothetical protein
MSRIAPIGAVTESSLAVTEVVEMLLNEVLEEVVVAVTSELVVVGATVVMGASVDVVVGAIVVVVVGDVIATATVLSAVVVPPVAGVAETDPMLVTLPELISDWVTT